MDKLLSSLPELLRTQFDLEVTKTSKLDGRLDGWHIHLSNGVVVSVQFGPGTYSDNHDLILNPPDGISLVESFEARIDYSPMTITAEVAIIQDGQWLNHETMEPIEEGTGVAEYQTVDQILDIIDRASSVAGIV